MGPTQSRNKLPSLPEPVYPSTPRYLGRPSLKRKSDHLPSQSTRWPSKCLTMFLCVMCVYIYIIYIYIHVHCPTMSPERPKLFSEKEMKIRAAAWPAYLGKVTLYSWKFIQICIPLRVNYICSWRGRTVSVSGMWTQVWKKVRGIFGVDLGSESASQLNSNS